ncbi:MAG: AMP-binding protein, partial [Halobacteriales archaeon]|nr:AMP-binding protein [Halobacteriales archaeon]
MHDPLARRSVVTPDRVAVIGPEGSTHTFAALDDEITELASRIADHGITSGDHLGTLLTEDRAAFSLVHAAMRLGCPLVPLNPKLDGETLSRHANQADVTLLVCDDATVEAAASIDGPDVVSVEQSEPVPTLAEASVESVTPGEWTLSDRLLLLFTSGTTGDPKAVTLTMGNVLSSAAASATRLGVLPDDR